MSWTGSLTLRRVRPPQAGPGAPAPAPLPSRYRTGRAATRRAAGRAEVQPTWRDWAGVLAMVTGLFLAIMDVQIVSSSLTQIQGGLSASSDEIAWVQSAYLIAAVVMVPFSGTLSRLLSTRVTFVIAALGFTVASVLCATATNLNQMILYRAMQGFSAGAITPSGIPVVYTRFRGAAADHAGDDLDHPEPVIDIGADDRRVPDRDVFVALAVSGQCRAGPARRRCGLGDDRHRQARLFLLRDFNVIGLVLMARFSAASNMRSRRAALGLARRRFDPQGRAHRGDRVGVLLLAGPATVAVVDLRAFVIRNFALCSFYHVPDRVSGGRHDPSRAAVSGPGSRLQQHGRSV